MNAFVGEDVRTDDPKASLAKYLRKLADHLERPGVLLVVAPEWLRVDFDGNGVVAHFKVDVHLNNSAAEIRDQAFTAALVKGGS